MGPIVIFSCFVSYLLLVLCAVTIHVQADVWLNAHATFYGANQSPTTLGKNIFNIMQQQQFIHLILLDINEMKRSKLILY